MSRPTLIVISGPAGTGKTTLAHAVAQAIGCPAICRDEIKEGMVHALGGDFEAAPGDPITRQTLPVFFGTLAFLLEAGVTVVAEAAFQHQVWQPHLEPLAGLADLRIIRCRTDPGTARERMVARGRRGAHADAAAVTDPGYYDSYVPISVPAPTIDVDTSHGYDPPIDRIVGFVNDG